MKNNQFGRSMIEMLGVLAIIGVLSVGSLAGYSKMMEQYRINKVLEQINIVSAKLSSQGSSGGSYAGLSAYTAYKLNALPAEMLDSVSGKTASLRNPYGGKVELQSASIISGSCSGDDCDHQAYTIVYDSLPEDACMALGGNPWNNSRNSSLIGMGIGNVAAKSTIIGGLSQNCKGKLGTNFVYACTGVGAADEEEEESENQAVVTLPLEFDTLATACNCEGGCVLVLKFF